MEQAMFLTSAKTLCRVFLVVGSFSTCKSESHQSRVFRLRALAGPRRGRVRGIADQALVGRACRVASDGQSRWRSP